MTVELFDYQIKSIEEMREIEKEKDITILNNETGSGKTLTCLNYLLEYDLPSELSNKFIYDIAIRNYLQIQYYNNLNNDNDPVDFKFDYKSFFPTITTIVVQNNILDQWKTEVGKMPKTFQDRVCFFKGTLDIEKAKEYLNKGKDIFVMAFSTSKNVSIKVGRVVCDENIYMKNITIIGVKYTVLSADKIEYAPYASAFKQERLLTFGDVKTEGNIDTNHIKRFYKLSMPRGLNELLKLNDIENTEVLTKLLENNKFFSDDIKLNIKDYMIELENQLKSCKKNSELAKKYQLMLNRTKTRMEEAKCSVCYEEDFPADKLVSLSCCQNTMCIQCVYYCTSSNQNNCPYCKKKNILDKIYIQEDAATVTTRLEAIQLLLEQNPDDSFVFFSFNDLIYSDALKELGIENYTAKFHLRKEVLKKFNAGECRGIYLNGYEQCTGLNLIKANHLVLMHSISDEKIKNQMIGRVVRLGQTKTVYVHQFLFNNDAEIEFTRLK